MVTFTLIAIATIFKLAYLIAIATIFNKIDMMRSAIFKAYLGITTFLDIG